MEERANACLALLAKGCSVREVCRILKISSKTVSSIRTNEYHPKKCGHPQIITDEHISFIEVNSIADARLTDGEIAEMTQKSLIFRCLVRLSAASDRGWASSTGPPR